MPNIFSNTLKFQKCYLVFAWSETCKYHFNIALRKDKYSKKHEHLFQFGRRFSWMYIYEITWFCSTFLSSRELLELLNTNIHPGFLLNVSQQTYTIMLNIYFKHGFPDSFGTLAQIVYDSIIYIFTKKRNAEFFTIFSKF